MGTGGASENEQFQSIVESGVQRTEPPMYAQKKILKTFEIFKHAPDVSKNVPEGIKNPPQRTPNDTLSFHLDPN